MLERCHFCRGRVFREEATIDYRWGEMLVVIRSVPAGVCHQCGEKYIDSVVYKEMERIAKNKPRLMGKISVDILEFQEAGAH
jgi:YgiT-type zinc finger domain-containing protein